MERLLIVAALTALIHLINTLVYAVRISGVRTQRLATALSLYNVIFLLASTANSIQGFLLASIVERAIQVAQTETGIYVLEELVFQPAYQVQLAIIEHDIRLVILAATIGTFLGWALIPAFVNVFNNAIFLFEKVGSVPRMLAIALFAPRRAAVMISDKRLLAKSSFQQARQKRQGIPKLFLVLNFFVTGVYTTGVLSALFAGALFPDFRTAATTLSAVVNGIATVLAATVVDPTAAAITDQALRGERSEADVKQMALYLSITRLLGTVFAQAIFVPAAYFVKYVATLLV